MMQNSHMLRETNEDSAVNEKVLCFFATRESALETGNIK